MALIAIGVAALLLIRSEQTDWRAGFVAARIRQHAREASDALTEARVAQHGYVAAGQGDAFWMGKVDDQHRGAECRADERCARPASPGRRTAIDEATATVAEFGNIDRRVRGIPGVRSER